MLAWRERSSPPSIWFRQTRRFLPLRRLIWMWSPSSPTCTSSSGMVVQMKTALQRQMSTISLLTSPFKLKRAATMTIKLHRMIIWWNKSKIRVASLVWTKRVGVAPHRQPWSTWPTLRRQAITTKRVTEGTNTSKMLLLLLINRTIRPLWCSMKTIQTQFWHWEVERTTRCPRRR